MFSLRKIAIMITTLLIATNLYAKKLPGVNWYEGSVKSAFKEAQKKSKPLFLYWGAAWCPPCNQMKKTVFTKKEFQTVTKKFINVYLDGDDERAQIWGDKLKAYGYPTMILFSSTGKELMRLPTGVSAAKYVSLMENALKGQKTIGEIFEAALTSSDKKPLSDDSWEIISGYSWAQVEDENLKEKLTSENMKKIYSLVPAKLDEVKARLFMRYLQLVVEEDVKKEIPYLQKELRRILSSKKLVLATLEDLVWNAKDFLKFLYPLSSDERAKLIFKWGAAMKKVNKNERLSLDERLSALFPLITLSPQTKEKNSFYVEQFAKSAFKQAKGEYERQAVVSTAVYLLRKIGKIDDAKKMAKKEIKTSTRPYYFMSQLASILEEEGKRGEALSWRKKGWEASTGNATRFQWGVDYVTAITRLDPANTESLKKTTLQVLRESLLREDALSGRNYYRLQRITKSFNKWTGPTSYRLKMIKDLKKELTKDCEKTALSRKCLDWVNSL